ncbi:MAG: DUF2934 domain-containing protein [Gammaproteobacteria bacterium]|nr:DUF2934 domain-containing protein [Gammaproteobacteria bacterium]
MLEQSKAQKAKKDIKNTSGNSPSRAGKSGKKAETPIVYTSAQRLQMISEAAYFIAEKRGFAGGNPAEDWLKAENEIDKRLSQLAG